MTTPAEYTTRVVEDVVYERGSQNKKWGTQRHPDGTEEAYHGVKTALDSTLKNAQYSIQRPDVLDFFSKAIDRAILFCPKCGKIALGLKGHSGMRFCPTCADKTEWPWPKDYE